jgi:MraZ protein
MFRGRYQLTIDPKGRLSIPAKFRDIIRSEYDGKLIVVPDRSDTCLQVYPLAEWEQQEERLRQMSSFNSNTRKLSRLFFSHAREAVLDGAGRILIAQDTREQAGLGRDVTIVAGGERHFEVWDRGRLQEFDLDNQHELRAALDKFSAAGG